MQCIAFTAAGNTKRFFVYFQALTSNKIIFGDVTPTLKIRILAWRKKSSTVLVSFKIKMFGTKNLKLEQIITDLIKIPQQ